MPLASLCCMLRTLLLWHGSSHNKSSLFNVKTHKMPAIRRTLKNVVKNYSDAQVKVREATSNDPWGPSSTLMSEIADLTYNVVAFTEIMQMVWKRLNDDGKNWRHVYKSLVVLDYIIKTGSEKVSVLLYCHISYCLCL